MYEANVYKVFLASPGDVTKEREEARAVIAYCNRLFGKKYGVILQPVGWETDTYSTMGEHPQDSISKQALADCEFLIAMFCAKIGTPTKKSASGTIQEIEEHLEAGKPAMLLFSKNLPKADEFDQEQYALLQKFKKEYSPKSYYKVFDGLEEFRQILRDDLIQRLNEQDPFVGHASADRSSSISDILDIVTIQHRSEEEHNLMTTLSDNAKELLLEAVQDRHGRIMKLRSMRDSTVQTNGKQMLRDNSPREWATWCGALDELLKHDLVEPVGHKGEGFDVTAKGYQLADKLKLE